MNYSNFKGTKTWLAALIFSAVAGTATASVTEPGLDSGMLDAMKRDLSLDDGQVHRLIELEKLALDLTEEARDTFGDRFAGGWIERDDAGEFRFVVAIAGDSRGVDAVTGAHTRQVVHSLIDLDATLANLDETAFGARGVLQPQLQGVHSWGIDLASNSVVITIAPDAERNATEFVANSKVDADRVRFEVSEGVPTPAVDIYGGRQWNGCSVGFAVTRGSTQGFVSAGHCGRRGTAVRIAGVTVGSIQGSNFPGVDYMWANVRNSPTDRLWGLVTRYNTGGYAEVRGSSQAAVGASVCRSGYRTGWRCGQITRTNVTVNYAQGAVRGLRQASACVGTGDSGGSVISGTQAQGLTSGGSFTSGKTENCTNPASQRVVFYQPVNPALSAYGVRLVLR